MLTHPFFFRCTELIFSAELAELFLLFFLFSSLQIVTNIRHAVSTMDIDVGKAILVRGCLEKNRSFR